MPQEITVHRPGEKALAAMKYGEVQVFKAPFAPLSKTARSKHKIVLDEDSYIEEVGKIIQRDFFPDLEKLKAQNEYLDAVEKNDIQKLRELYEKYSSGRPPTERYASPATFETPVDARREEQPSICSQGGNTTHSAVSEAEKEKTDEQNKGCKQSLDEYLSSHTSEDNQSFQEIMREAEDRFKHKYAWLYEAEERCKDEQKHMLTLPSIEEQAMSDERPLMVDTWGYRNKNFIMYVPDGVSLTPEEQVEMAKKRQEVVYPNTRLIRNPFNEQQNKEVIHEMAQSQAKAKEGKIGVDGKELTQGDTPKVNGYGFVNTPSPAPGVNETPLMTWGEIEGTPFRLDGSDTPVHPTPGPSFKIPDLPKREKLALELAEQVSQKHRDKKMRAIQAARIQLSTPSPRPGSAAMDRLNTMSPAAQRLASTQMKHIVTDRALRASYSPSPRTSGTPHTTPMSGHSSARALRTPRVGTRTDTPTGQKTKRITGLVSLTDNLLNLPKRPRASDFFDT